MKVQLEVRFNKHSLPSLYIFCTVIVFLGPGNTKKNQTKFPLLEERNLRHDKSYFEDN